MIGVIEDEERIIGIRRAIKVQVRIAREHPEERKEIIARIEAIVDGI
jgi:hypothetical protein